MSTLTSSIVRGFGFTVGKTAANALLQPKPVPVNKTATGTGCYSHLGYQEGDVEITYDKNWKKSYVGFFGWLFYLLFPFLNVWVAFIKLISTFSPNTYMHFYEMKWNQYQVSDARFKSGIREVKILQPEFVKSVVDTPRTRNKVEAVIAFMISWILTGPLAYTIYIMEIAK